MVGKFWKNGYVMWEGEIGVLGKVVLAGREVMLTRPKVMLTGRDWVY